MSENTVLPELPFSPYLVVDWSSGEKGKTMYDAKQMREYAQAAILASQSAQVRDKNACISESSKCESQANGAQVGDVVAPFGYVNDSQVEYQRKNGGSVSLWLRPFGQYQTPLYAAPRVAREQKDAERYRFLRAGFGDFGPDMDLHNAFVDGGDKMDAAIDAAIAANAGNTKGD